MKNSCYLLLLGLAFSEVASASSEANLTGTWVATQLDRNAVKHDIRVLITQKGNDFLFERDLWQDKLEYIADGTKRQLHQIGTRFVTYYTAKWEGESLIIDKKIDASPPPNTPSWFITPSRYIHEVWSISADGMSLTNMNTFKSGKPPKPPYKKIRSTLVYTKVDNR
jgi:hypothetical protein